MAIGELDMNLEGLGDCTCCMCKSFNQEIGNKLMECHTCQNLFHQGCHEPPVSNDEANDPRLVWNCSECLRKQVGSHWAAIYRDLLTHPSPLQMFAICTFSALAEANRTDQQRKHRAKRSQRQCRRK